jgi:hypothetical protein
MKETAMDWLFSKLWDIERDKFEWQSILKKAKEMEKEQIINAFKDGAFYPGYELQAEQYYWENYKNK